MPEMTQADVEKDIRWLYSKLASRDPKYLRSFNRFLSNGKRQEGIRQVYTTPASYYNVQTDQDSGVLPAINVGRSMVLTLQSKLIQTKGRIFFSPTNGLWETIKVCRNAQILFDAIIEREAINDKVKRSLGDALIFDLGVILVDDETKSLRRIKPWCFYADPAELDAGKVSRCYVMEDDYPLNALADKLTDKTPNAKTKLKNDWFAKAKVYWYWDLKGKTKWLFVDAELVESKKIEYDCMPMALFYYNDPIKGLYSTSVMDNSYQNQRQIDDILHRIHDALYFSPSNTVYVPSPDGNVGKIISNKAGTIVPILPGGGTPVVATPPPIDPGYQNMLEFFIQATYESEGVSQLSATSKKPAGADSGVALDTLQDVESERFQTQVDNLIKFYRDIYTIMIKVFPQTEEILPKRIRRAKVTWGQLNEQFANYSLTSSLASVLSKDPAVKMTQIEKLAAGGVINKNMVASLLQLPDLEGAYSAATASYDDCLKIIERAIDEEKYDFYPIVNLRQLLDESVNTLLQLDAVDEDPRILLRLNKLIEEVLKKLNAVGSQNASSMPPPPPSDVAAQGMNGIQVQALQAVVQATLSGNIPVPQASALIGAAFPGITPDMIQQMLGAPPSAPSADAAPSPETPEEAPAGAPVSSPAGNQI